MSVPKLEPVNNFLKYNIIFGKSLNFNHALE